MAKKKQKKKNTNNETHAGSCQNVVSGFVINVVFFKHVVRWLPVLLVKQVTRTVAMTIN